VNFGKIMVVEDSELLHRMYDLIFMRYRRNGTKVVHCMNGRDALNQLNNHPDTDMIILDINMPVMSGLEFLHHCKKEHVFRHIPVIIISTEGKQDDTLRGLKAGAKGYITKPFQANALLKIMEDVISVTAKSNEEQKNGLFEPAGR
jgi:two-component system, chemotaxis family, chemotaxis protein CheY